MKRGIEKKTLIALILLLVGLLVMWPVIGHAISIGQGLMDGGVCGASVALSNIRWQADYTCGLVEVSSPTGLRCERRHIELTSEGMSVAQGGSKETLDLRGSQQYDAAAIETVVLEELRSCWQRFGKGEQVLFGEIGRNLEFSNEKTMCHICTEINIQEGTPLQGMSLQERLDTNMLGASETYRDFFNNARAHCQDGLNNEACWDDLQETLINNERVSSMNELSADKTYAVVIMRRGYGFCEDDSQGSFSNFVYLVAHDELNTACSEGILT